MSLQALSNVNNVELLKLFYNTAIYEHYDPFGKAEERVKDWLDAGLTADDVKEELLKRLEGK